MECFPTQMSIVPLFALPSGIEITACSPQEGVLCVSLLSTQSSSLCPLCGAAATRIHSHYQRRLTDLPSTGQPVRFQLSVRKFFCDESTCPRKIFTERLAPFVARKRFFVGRWTHRRKIRSEEHTSELQSRQYLVCRLLLEKKNKKKNTT